MVVTTPVPRRYRLSHYSVRTRELLYVSDQTPIRSVGVTLHAFVDESDRQRRRILDTIAKNECVHTLIYICRGSQVAARQECMTALVCDLIDRKANRLVMESVSTLRAGDRRCIAARLRKSGAELSYTHMRPHEEPGLWLPDAIVWAYGAGGHWRRRIQPAIEIARDLGGVR
jgi:hypothetical protein